MKLLAFPDRGLLPGGTVHVMPDPEGGFQVVHESSSGSSWGGWVGPYQLAETAIAAAYALARETYGGCEVAIWSEVRSAVEIGSRLPNYHFELGDF